MEAYQWLYSISSFLFLFLAFKFFSNSNSKLPPSPIPLPILGHLHLLISNNQSLHRTFHNLSLKYGPILSLRFGFRQVVIISSPSAVKECFTKNDICLANRPPLTIGKILGYNHTNISGSPYGDHWRNLRRITSLQILSSNRLDSHLGIRRDEITMFLKSIYNQVSPAAGNYIEFGEVELKSRFSELTFNTIVQTVTGKKYGSEKAKQLREIIAEVMKCAETSYAGDYLPFMKWIDYGGFLKKVTLVSERTDSLLQELVDEQRDDPKGHDNTVISYLINLQKSQPDNYTDEIIKGLILRDLKLWDDAHKFKPERFEQGADLASQKYRLMPFGQGRRACPGMGLANRLLGFALGSLIQCFEWKRLSDEEIDMNEGNGITMPKAVPLVAMCKPRDIAYQLFK